MKNIIRKTTLAVATAVSAFAIVSCDDVFDPAIENQLDEDMIFSRPVSAWNMLGNAYISLPFNTLPESDYATDDCVNNNESNAWHRMGANWTKNSDPTNQWTDRYKVIQYLNLFLSRVDEVKFSIKDPITNQMFIDHAKGEAYAMRALNFFYLLRNHAGPVNGILMGVPIKTEYETGAANFNVARNTLSECVEFILDDINKALSYLPYENGNVSSADENEFIKKYVKMYDGNTKAAMQSYAQTFGDDQKGKMCGRYVIALRAKMMLWAASPAFSAASGVKWEDAAKYCAEVIGDAKIAGLDPNGHNWFTNYSRITNLEQNVNDPEFIWRSNKEDNGTKNDGSNEWEQDSEVKHFPKSLYGNGRCNPTQNLVDAFPMLNGYPITDSRSGYDKDNIYANRDPRLADAILKNGDAWGASQTPIVTGSYSENTDGINRKSGESTRTGYYLKKLLRSDVNLGSTKVTQYHIYPRFRMTEFYLSYAEAANEAWGPTGTGSYGMSALDIIKAIRNRAGVGTEYVDEVAAKGTEAFRELIKNERRIEFCFENQRLYDLRRWLDLPKLKSITLQGIDFKSSDPKDYEIITIQNEYRNYEDYMNYAPIPNSEILKFSNLQQNDGWN